MTFGWWNRLRAIGNNLRFFHQLAAEAVEPLAPELTEAPNSAPVRDTFCILAWNHLQIAPNGTVKMCCIAAENISEGKRPMSLYTDTYDEIWNSSYMRDARRGMASGERISPCRRCFDEEDAVGQSRRTIQNAIWLAQSDKSQQDLIEIARSNDWRILQQPSYLQLNMGNLCNLSCRMCSSHYSSKIEHDPVHSKWMPTTFPDVARWRGKKLHLGPRPFFGVSYEGFYDYEVVGESAVRWCSGVGAIKSRIPEGEALEAVGLSLQTIGDPLQGTIRVNGLEVFEGVFTPEWMQRFELAGLGNQTDLEIEIETAATEVGGRTQGVGLLDVWIERRKPEGNRSANRRALMRYAADEGWWAQPEIMFGEILGEPNRERYIAFQGGEPLLLKEFERILDVLVSNGSASKTTFEIVSNLTTIKDSTFSKLAQLKQLNLGPSIDGIGPILEYIRYPAVWADIERNLERFAALRNVKLGFNTAVQAYNLGDVVNILSYCDRHGFDINMHFVVAPPYLNVAVLPQTVRRAAIERVSTYLEKDNLRPGTRSAAEYVVRFLREQLSVEFRDQFTYFMKFTNDLDISRGQSFRNLYPELINAFANDGLQWTDETQFAKPITAARSRRD